MAESQSDQSFLELLRQGDESTAREIFDRYVDNLVALARKRISQRLASRIDAEDIVQSVFRTFFLRAREGKFQLQEKEDVCKMLARITMHKTFRQIAHHLAAKRNATRDMMGSENSQELLQTLRNHEPTPEEAAELLDQMEHFLAQLRSEDRKILELKMQGHTTLEIAQQLNISDRKIRRLMERIRSLAVRDDLFAVFLSETREKGSSNGQAEDCE